MGWNDKTFKVVYISKTDWNEHVTFVQASDKYDASSKAQQELRGVLHTIQSITEC